MIVDFHTHILDYQWLPQKWWDWLEDYYQKAGPLTLGRRKQSSLDNLLDPDGNKLLQELERCSFDKAVVLPLDWGLLLGEPEKSIEEQHEAIYRIAQKSEGKLLPFVGIDPRRPNAIELIDFYLSKRAMAGIKLYPAAGYDLRQQAFKGVFEKAEEYGVPVLIHSGFSFGPFLSQFCTPLVFDFLCATYPKVNFIAAHMGGGFLEQFCWLAYAKPNLYLDCSLMQIICKQNYQDFAGKIRLACNLAGNQKILFGTDFPFSQTVLPNEIYADAFKKLASLSAPETQFSSLEIKQILGKNAVRLLPS